MEFLLLLVLLLVNLWHLMLCLIDMLKGDASFGINPTDTRLVSVAYSKVHHAPDPYVNNTLLLHWWSHDADVSGPFPQTHATRLVS